ncbi:MAG TPA: type II toxin-antitoxin system VapC family toxin [Polyangiaceae bacterium]|jgi:predicted nucleic acid-binding protein
MSAERVIYVDSSAIVKLVVREPESAALVQYLRRHRPSVSSVLARVEVERACLPLGQQAIARARDVLGRFDLVRINERVLAAAAELLPAELLSLDAIHLATAALFGKSLAAVITYDARMRDAARTQGFRVLAPR